MNHSANEPNLLDMEWRDANLSTLHEWHPRFKAIAPALDEIDTAFRLIMLNYKRYLLQSGDARDSLETHVREEVLMWLLQKFESSIEAVWFCPTISPTNENGECIPTPFSAVNSHNQSASVQPTEDFI